MKTTKLILTIIEIIYELAKIIIEKFNQYKGAENENSNN